MDILNGNPSKIVKQRNLLLKWLIPTIIASLALVISFLAYFHSIKSNKISNRPFVAIIEAHSYRWPALTKNKGLDNLGTNVKIMNVGRTPAFRTKIITAINIYGKEFINSPEYRDSSRAEQVLINDKIYDINVDSFRKFTKEEINDVIDKKKFIYAYGEITYTDIFEDEHLTRFCFIWDLGWTQLPKYSELE